jgi:hypothetical protein
MLKSISLVLHSLLLMIFVGSFSSIIYYLNTDPGAAPAGMVTSTPVPNLPGIVDVMPDTMARTSSSNHYISGVSIKTTFGWMSFMTKVPSLWKPGKKRRTPPL